MSSVSAPSMRRLPVWGFVLLAAVYLAIVQIVPNFTKPSGTEYGNFESTEEIARVLWVAVGVGVIVVFAAVAYLRWWRPVFVEENRLPRWVWFFPIAMLVAILGGTAYSRLGEQGLAFTGALLIGALLVGVSEEGMFRGIGVTSFRQAGYSEGMVALWTSVLFGLAHAANLFTEGIGALPQVLTTAVAGYFLYLARRVSGTIIVAMLIHGLWDFALFSNTIGDTIGFGASLIILVDVILLVVALATIRKIFPREAKHHEATDAT